MRLVKKAAVPILVLALFVGAAAFTACGDIVPTSITAECLSSEYTEGETFDRAGTTVTALYSDGSSRTVAGWTVTDEPLEAGMTSVTISYTENGVTVTTNVNVTVAEIPHVHDFSSAVYGKDASGHWKVCACGEIGERSAHDWDDKTEIIDEIGCDTAGRQRVTCTVCGYSEIQDVPAQGHDWSAYGYDGMRHWQICRRCGVDGEKNSHALEFTVSGLKTDYLDGETLTADGASASVYCDECGYSSAVNASELVLPQESLTLDDDGETFSLTYGDYSWEFAVTVTEREVQSVTVKDGITTEYALDEQFDGKGALVLHYDGAADREIPITEEMLRGFDTSTPGSVNVTVSYAGKTAQFTIYVGRDETSGAFRLGEPGAVYKVQAEDADYVDMNDAKLQTGNPPPQSKFENTAESVDGSEYPNGAEGYSTANISVEGNKITVKFYSDYAGKLRLGMRAQSGSNKGLDAQPLDDAFSLFVNDDEQVLSGTLKAGSSSGNGWKDMTVWTYLDDIAGLIDVREGLNTIVFAFKGETAGTMRFPNIDYFTLEISDNAEHTLTVEGGGSVDGQNFVSLAFGEPIPEITWDDPASVVAIEYDGGIYTGTDGLTMASADAVIKAIRPSDCDNVILQQDVSGNNARYNTGRTDELGKTAPVGNTDTVLNASYIDVYGTGDGMVYTLSNVHGSARGVTFKEIGGGGINFGESGAKTAVFVSFTNNGEEDLTGIEYGTECGVVSIGDAGAGKTVTASAIVTSDGGLHWTHLFWNGTAPTSFTIAIYIYTL